jgi:hypothetical protein
MALGTVHNTILTRYVRDARCIRNERNDRAGKLQDAHLSAVNVLRRKARHCAILTFTNAAEIGRHPKGDRQRLVRDALPEKLFPSRIVVTDCRFQQPEYAEEKHFDVLHRALIYMNEKSLRRRRNFESLRCD